MLEEVPDISYDDVGGLDDQIEPITDAVELPFVHRELFAEHKLPAPKGILLYGPPGCGKTLIAKAVANSPGQEGGGGRPATRTPRSYFLNIKGPELLNKYVGETERQIRLVFQRAREKSEEGWPVIVFFDEMDSLFRTRGTGISLRHGVDDRAAAAGRDRRRRDAEERDRDRRVEPRGPHRPRHPAARPPRREDQDRAARTRTRRRRSSAATSPPTCRSAEDEVESLGGGDRNKAVAVMIERTVEEMYRADDANRFLEVTYQNGDKEVMYFKDFSSGAMIENIVRRAKKLAIKRLHRRRERRASAPTTCSRRSSRSTRSTRTCPTPPTPTTGRRSRARRASASSTCARSSSPRPSERPAAGPSSGSRRASTSDPCLTVRGGCAPESAE